MVIVDVVVVVVVVMVTTQDVFVSLTDAMHEVVEVQSNPSALDSRPVVVFGVLHLPLYTACWGGWV